ncbi:lipopolysaccharide assembly LapA domain-containing protein [Dechloromonas sp. CZR5]|uniref:LapA family protein n=1 Tax=Dechloromonas sp. CZR5 TaxID=2608630 RepID=UPI001CC37FCD|nr:lipopolysaccharide assembly protein LapA domain-containing protein [Dechloromonas sp. CZR5]
MTALTWAIRLIIFIFLVVFAAQNTDPVSLRLLPGQIWQAPLVLALLAFFVGGIVIGALSLLGVLFRQRREISRLKKAATRQPQAPSIETPPAV